VHFAKVFLKSALFPFPSLWQIIITDPKPIEPKCRPYDEKIEDFISVLGSLVKDVILGYLIYLYTMNIHAAAEFRWEWMLPIIVRDFCLNFFVAGSWDWMMYFSPIAPRLHKYKINPTIPPMTQFKHDIFFTTLATLTASATEIVLLHCWAKGYVPYYLDFSQYPLWLVLWIVTMPYWRLGHFFIIHRMMHPWRVPYIPDLGKLLYKHVHSHHHKSPNPSAWSGISMHPVEAFLYYHAALFPYIFSHHPILFAITKVDLTIGAMVGHDGFNEPGSASYFHYLHHKFFEVNYGDKLLPFDLFFGTYSGDGSQIKKEIKKLL